MKEVVTVYHTTPHHDFYQDKYAGRADLQEKKIEMEKCSPDKIDGNKFLLRNKEEGGFKAMFMYMIELL